ncbi:MAG: aldo/keto reductase [Rhodospirillales bacterium]
MEQRALGCCGLMVSALGLGCMGMSWAYGTPDDAEAIAPIHRVIDHSITFFDTAEVYGPYANERLLGRAIRDRREGLVIATKFGFRITAEGKADGTDGRPETVRAVCDASLTRLGIEVIDLFYQHRRDRSVPIEDTVGAMADLVARRKCVTSACRRCRPIPCGGPARCIRSAPCRVNGPCGARHRGGHPAGCTIARRRHRAIQPVRPGLSHRNRQAAEEYPAADYRHREPRLQGEHYDANMRIVAGVEALAAAKGATPAQLALAWLPHQGADVAPIPGTKRRRYWKKT